MSMVNLNLLRFKKIFFLIVLMKIGYQGKKNCYSYQVINNYLDNKNISCIGYTKFENVFEAIENNEIDFAVLPIENSLGGCIFVNYDLFYKYDISIHCEFHHNVNHSLYSINSNLNEIDKVISHPQAIQQCINNIKKNNFTYEEFWDTTGSLDKVKELNDPTLACISPPNLGEKYGLNELVKNFNDQDKNITRFYLLGKKENNIPEDLLQKNLNLVKNKFSGYVIAKDEIGILNDYLIKFKELNCNLTKIESRPYLGTDRNIFSYIFYIEGIIQNNFIESLSSFNTFGVFPLLEKNIIKEKNKNILNVGIIGFGRFGQFIGEQMVKYGFKVFATSRSDYSKISEEIGITFLKQDDFLSLNLDIVILSTSILSFEQVFLSYPDEFWKNKLVVDVLSVKNYPSEILNKYLNQDQILLTHPMFGPDSAKFSWYQKNFVYWYYQESLVINKFLEFWEKQGCKMIKMNPEEHDNLTANSQFLTHFIGRTLELLECKNTLVDTDGYKSLVTIKNHSVNDSWDLFYALAKYNLKSLDTINKLKFQLNKLEEKIIYPDGKIIKQSETGKMNEKIVNLKSQGKEIINSAIGVPSWYPNLEYNSAYSTAKGNKLLIDELVKYYNNDSISSDNLLIVSGAKPGIYLSLKLLTYPGTKWIIPKPYWTSYPDMIELENGSTIFLESNVEKNWDLNLQQIEEHYKDNMVNGIIICNPNNPTGLLYDEDFLINLLKISKKYDKYLIMDEVYLPLTDKSTLYYNAINSKFDKMIVVSSFSKYWAVPGWRVGWVLANKDLISKLVKIQSTTLTCAPNASQEVCYKLLKENFKPDLSVLKKSGGIIRNKLISKGWVVPENKDLSMYLFPVNYNIEINSFVENLLSKGLGVISGKPFGYDNAIRMTLPNNKEDLNKIINILDES